MIAADLSVRAEVAACSQRRPARSDILVANAGVPASGRLESFDAEESIARWKSTCAPRSRWRARSLPEMLERRRGHLVFMSSIAGKATSPGTPLYHATKYGLRGFAAALRDRPPRQRRWRLDCLPGLHPRRRHLRRRRGEASRRGSGHARRRTSPARSSAAIERNRGEIDVAPLPPRAGARIASLAPDFAARVARRARDARRSPRTDGRGRCATSAEPGSATQNRRSAAAPPESASRIPPARRPRSHRPDGPGALTAPAERGARAAGAFLGRRVRAPRVQLAVALDELGTLVARASP